MAGILKKSLYFFLLLIWKHQKDILKLTDLYLAGKWRFSESRLLSKNGTFLKNNLLISWSAYLDCFANVTQFFDDFCEDLFLQSMVRFLIIFIFWWQFFYYFNLHKFFWPFYNFFFQYFNYDFFEIFLICWTIFGGNVFWQFSKLFQIEYFQLSELLIEVPSTLLANYQLKSPFNKL